MKGIEGDPEKDMEGDPKKDMEGDPEKRASQQNLCAG